jgi:hypothetical protein
MKKTLTLLIIIFKLPSLFALDSPSFNLQQQQELDKKVTDHLYRQYMRPQIENLVHDFYQAYDLMIPLHKDILLMKSSLKKMEELLEKIRTDKSDLQHDELARFPLLLKEVEEKVVSLLETKKEEFYLFQNKSNLLSLQELRAATNIQMYAHQNLLKMLLKIWEIQTKANLATQLHGPSGLMLNHTEMQRLLNQLITYQHLQYFAHFPRALGHHWYQVHHDFIDPLEHILYSPVGKRELLFQLERLNVSWNFFHQFFTGIKEKTSFERSLEVIQMRWNSILKIVF